MKLSELRTILRRDYLDDFTQMLEGSPDSQWAPGTLDRYISEAQEVFARDTWSLEDISTSAVCDVTLVALQADYALHSSILQVLSVRPADSEVDLHWTSYDTSRAQARVDPDIPWGEAFPYTSNPGRPQLWTTDRLARNLRVFPAPRAADVTAIGTLKLRVVRLPISPLIPTEAVPDPEPEIDARHHLKLLDYAAGRALIVANVDAGSRVTVRQQARDFFELFDKAVGKAKVDAARFARGPAIGRAGGWGRREA